MSAPTMDAALTKRWLSSPARWLLPLILFLGLGLRLAGLIWGQGYSYFCQGDGLEAYSVAVDLGHGEPRAWYIGQPNYNLHSKLPGPLWATFCWLGLRAGGSIEGVIFETILLNTAAIYLTFLLARRTVGEAAALWAALMHATLPSAVFYSVEVYNPEVMPFLGGILFLGLWSMTQHHRSKGAFLAAFVPLMMLQFHMSGSMLIPTILLLLWIGSVRINFPWLIAGATAGLCLYAPYLVGEATHHWSNTRGMLAGGPGLTWDTLKALTTPLNLLISWVPQWSRSFGEYREMGRACFGWFPLLLASNALSAIVAVTLVVKAGRRIGMAFGFLGAPASPLARSKALLLAGGDAGAPRGAAGWSGKCAALRLAYKREPGILFLAILLVTPILLSMITGRPFHARYGLVLLPALVALAGAAVADQKDSPDRSIGVRPSSGAAMPAQKQALRTSSDQPAADDAAPGDGRAPRRHFSQLLRAAVLLTALANVWFMAAMFHHQYIRIERGQTFIPSFRQLESIYQRLKAQAGWTQPIKVEDSAYLASLSPGDEVHRDAELIRRYVAVREKEIGIQAGAAPLTYTLGRAKEVDANTVYRAHGLAIVAD